MPPKMLSVSLALLGSVNATETLLIAAALFALFGARMPALLLRLSRRAGRR